jgi:hypothetical protein
MTDPVTSLQPTVQAWADIVIKEFDNKVRLLHIHEGELVRSFVTHVLWHAGGNLQRVEFAFEYYGKFVDMGVGRGVNLQNRDAMIGAGATSRRPKPWFTDTFYKQLAVLRGILSERLAQNTQLAIVRNIRDAGSSADPIEL